jgi:hypothetical protein
LNRRIEAAHRILGIGLFLLVLLAIILLYLWSRQAYIDSLAGPDPLTGVLLSSLIKVSLYACALTITLVLAAKKPKIAFGVSVVLGSTCLLWSVYGFLLVAQALAGLTVQNAPPDQQGIAYITGLLSSVLPPASGDLLIGIVVLPFSIRAFAASRALERSRAKTVVQTIF